MDEGTYTGNCSVGSMEVKNARAKMVKMVAWLDEGKCLKGYSWEHGWIEGTNSTERGMLDEGTY